MPVRHRILIVDDDALDRRAVVRALRRDTAEIDGVEADVQEVDSISAAREALRSEEFACVFLDHNLPDGTSLDLLMEVRARGLATPVVVLTGERDEQAIDEVMRAGAVDYLSKERLHPDLVARSLRAALRFLEVQREKQAALEELHARDRAIAAATNGIVLADPRQPDCPLVYANEAFLHMTGYTSDEVLGRNCRFLQGPGTDPAAVGELREAIHAERACQVSILNYRKDGTAFWNEVTVSPVQDEQGRLTHFVGIQTDVTGRHKEESERRRSENELRQFQFLSDNSNDALFLLDENGHFLYVNAAACRSLGLRAEEFRQLRPFDIDPLHDDATYQALFRRAEGERLPPFESIQRRRDGTTFPIEASVTRLDIGGQPLLLSSCRDISERKKAESELAAAYHREALLNRIGQAVRQALPAEEVERTALTGLAEALGADRCLSILIDRAADRVRFVGEWHREDLPPLQGDYSLSAFGVVLPEIFPAGGTLVVSDTQTYSWSSQTAELMAQMQIRALLDVPLTEAGEVVGVLGIYMADTPRLWTDAEIAVVEAVASQLRSATEAARVRQREHRIAEQLQSALQPELPDYIAGLSVGKYTKPALDEAQIGGDFYDIFALDKELHALVIGDVSGKGLAAAQQLALIRNSLRTTLYLHRKPALAASSLNEIITAHDLLIGFVTVFVGVYEAATGEIAYCSCGHEPGIVRRTNGTVEELETTGPPLGVSEHAQYGEKSVTLADGDTLFLYTDGLSEAGPNRREMLGTEGLKRLVRALPAALDAPAAAKALVAEVSAYTNDVFRDDVAVLVVRRQANTLP